MSLELKVLIIGKDNKDTKKIKKFLEDKGIPYTLNKLRKNETFDKKIPACYVGNSKCMVLKK